MNGRVRRWSAAVAAALVLALLSAAQVSAHPMSSHTSWTNNDTLSSGSVGDIVAVWQLVLFLEGYLDRCGANGIDGIFGSNTDTATRRYQSQHGVTGGADGIVGPNTWSHAFSHVKFFVQVPGFDYYRYDATTAADAPSALRWNYATTQWQAFIPVAGGWKWIGSNHPTRNFTPCNPDERSGRNKQVVFVHGIDSDASGGFGTGCEGTWRDMFNALRAWGWTRSFSPVQYYVNDSTCSTTSSVVNERIDGHGNHTAYGSSGHLNGSHTADATIEHLAYHFAWFVYHRFTQNGIVIDVAAHSMGGLITRYAIHAVQNGFAAFPPTLLIEDVVTFGTPHGGAVFAGTCNWVQCDEMVSDSPFITNLQANASNPQALGHTEWTAIGAADDVVVGVANTTAMNAAHKVQYDFGQNLGHSAYMHTNSGSTATTAHASFQDFGGSWIHSTSFPWPVRVADFAMAFTSW